MLSGKRSDRFVIHSDEISRKSRQSAIYQDVWCFLFFYSKEQVHRGTAGGNDQCIEPPSQKLVDLLLLKIRVFLGGRDD